MRVVFRMSAIVAALAVATSVSMAGCGQRGPLYLPSVPPLPPKPVEHTEPSSKAAPAALPDTDTETDTEPASDASASKPLMLAPADDLRSAASGARSPSPASAASNAAPSANQ